MKSTDSFALVFVTAPSLRTARKLADAALTARLAACVNLVQAVESRYRWRGQLERATEILMMFKTSKKNLAALEKLLIANHPYDTPEFLVLPVNGGNKKYLAWLAENRG